MTCGFESRPGYQERSPIYRAFFFGGIGLRTVVECSHMEKHLQSRPNKKTFSQPKQDELKKKAVDKIKASFLPDDKIIKIILMGSSVKGTFGKYDPPGFRNSLYSDFDFIVFVKNDYDIPNWLTPEPDGKPFADSKLNLAFRNKRFVEDTYDVEVFILKEASYANPDIIREGEMAGIPMTNDSPQKHEIVYVRQ